MLQSKALLFPCSCVGMCPERNALGVHTSISTIDSNLNNLKNSHMHSHGNRGNEVI